MLKLALPKRNAPCTVLCLGAHSDDIEIGCGGTVLELLRKRRDLHFHWIVFSGGREREGEARRSASLFLRAAKRKQIDVCDFRDGYFPFSGRAIKDHFELLKKQIAPDLIFTHTGRDFHQDHRLINQLTWNTWRNHLILEYEIPKYDGDLGSPNFYVPFDGEICSRKIGYLMKCFGTQRDKHWFTEDTFQGLMRIRGLEANAPGKFAEAFYCRKIVFGAYALSPVEEDR